jgi:uncharacterized protein YndB with AHSA1/START domain
MDEMADKIEVSIDIAAPADKVWAALTEPRLVKTYMMGAALETDWVVGHPITWSGEYKGKPYQDKGVVKAVQPGVLLTVTHWSPLSGLADKAENYHMVTYQVVGHGGHTHLTLTQENLTGTSPEQSRKNWEPMLDGLKRMLEAP